MSHAMRKTFFSLSENKGADQLHSNCEADQCLYFCYTDSTIIIPLLISKISSFKPSPWTVQAGLCQTRSELLKTVFTLRGSNIFTELLCPHSLGFLFSMFKMCFEILLFLFIYLHVNRLTCNNLLLKMSRLMGKPTICICENKDADQLRSNCEADQRLCFRYTDSTLPLLFKSEISSFQPASVTVQPDLCRTCSETTLLVFPRGGSNLYINNHYENLPMR